MIIFLTMDKLLQVDRLGIKPYWLFVRIEEQKFDNLNEIKREKSLGMIYILEIE